MKLYIMMESKNRSGIIWAASGSSGHEQAKHTISFVQFMLVSPENHYASSSHTCAVPFKIILRMVFVIHSRAEEMT